MGYAANEKRKKKKVEYYQEAICIESGAEDEMTSLGFSQEVQDGGEEKPSEVGVKGPSELGVVGDSGVVDPDKGEEKAEEEEE